MNESTGILLTEPDAARLERSIIEQLLRSPDESQDATELEAILDEAAVVPARVVDSLVVTMNSVVVLEDLPSARRLTVSLPSLNTNLKRPGDSTCDPDRSQ